MSQNGRKTILFVAEAVTLAHVARPFVLARSLDPEQFDIHFACASRFNALFANAALRRWQIQSVSSEQFLRALRTGSRLYSSRELAAYVEEDLRLLKSVRPDLVVGDFRLSLAVSAPLCGISYATIANAYWSPFTTISRFPVPDVPITSLLGVAAATEVFNFLRPAIFAYHARPLNKVRLKYGLPSLGSLLDVYTHGNYTLYADLPTLFPTINLPAHHRFLGPLLWSPDVCLPSWWAGLDRQRPIVYVNLGSSGPEHLLPFLLDTLAKLPLTVVCATAGHRQSLAPHANVYVSDYLPGDAVSERAALVICNGGSLSVYQALANALPVIGIASNLDQMLCMSGVVKADAGLLLRAGKLSGSAVERSIDTALNQGRLKAGAEKLAGELARVNGVAAFQSILNEVV